MVETRLLTVPEAASRVSCSRHTLYRAIAAGRLQAVRLGTEHGRLRIAETALDRFLVPAGTREREHAAG